MTPYERANFILAIVALAVSVVAVVVALLTLYFTFFHRRAQLVGALVLLDEKEREDLDIEMEYLLCNTGNVQLLLKNITVQKTGAGEDPKVTGAAILDSAHAPDLPILIEPQNTRLVTARVKKDDLRVAHEHNEWCFVVFEIFSARGKFYEARHNYTKLEVQLEPRAPDEPLVVWREPEVWKLFKLKRAD